MSSVCASACPRRPCAGSPAARAIQERLAGGFHVDDFFPEAADLPEDIQDAELQARYGGVGGPLFRTYAAEVERRL